jgi:hypothetical protein
VSFALGMTLIPVCLTFLHEPPARGETPHHRWLLPVLRAAARLSTTQPRIVLAVFTLLTAALAAGIPLLRNNTDLIRFLRSDAPLHRDTLFIDEHLTGALPLEFVLARRASGSLASAEAMTRLAAFEEAVRHRPRVTATTSITAVLRQLHRAETGADAAEMPRDDEAIAYYFALLEAAEERDLLRRLITPDLSRAHLTVRLHASGTAESGPLVEAMLADAGRIFGDDYELTPTGAVYHVIRDSTRLVREQVSSFGLAIALVVAAIGLLLRSLAFTVVAFIPNLMPILWTGGIMGFCGIDLSTGTAMIASAVLGLAVDDTIHYLVHYRRAYAGDAVSAIYRTTTGVGAPVTITSAVLVAGFWVGAFGSFKPTIYFSLLTGTTMIIGALCDLLVLPASLLLLERWTAGRGRATR